MGVIIAFTLGALLILAALVCTLSNSTITLPHCGYNYISAGKETIDRPNKTDRKCNYVYGSTSGPLWECSSVLIARPTNSFAPGKCYAFTVWDPSNNLYPVSGIIARCLTREEGGIKFSTYIPANADCKGEIVGIRTGNLNYYF